MIRRAIVAIAFAATACQSGTSPDPVDPGPGPDDPVEQPGAASQASPSTDLHNVDDILGRPPTGHWTAPPVEYGEGAFLTRQLMVQVDPAVDLGELAARHGTRAITAPGPRGIGAVEVPKGADPQVLLADLLADSDVRQGGRMGLMVGSADGWAVAHQWHHDAMARPNSLPPGLEALTIAVLDTGVAYEDFVDENGQVYVAAPSLASTTFVAPWDFVNDDAHPNDDHQHGTHLTSLIASQGDVVGVAPGVKIMPVKVLDHRKRGTELDLIRGLDHAVENGAHVINLSLSFPSGYVASPLLQRALQDASEAGIVLVGAAGNASVNEVTWPATSPHVIAVGASDPTGGLAAYSNWSAQLDLLAPGGDLTRDRDGNGFPDGILGETIALQDPTQTGLWFVEGTSQATALVTGAVALRLAVDPEPRAVLGVLHKESSGAFQINDGHGAGHIDASAAIVAIPFRPHTPRYGSIRPFLVDLGGGKLQPGVAVRVVHFDGLPVKRVEAIGRVTGSLNQHWSCMTDKKGLCTTLFDVVDGDATTDSLAFVVNFDGIDDGHPHVDRVGRIVVASDALNVLTAAMALDERARDATILFVDEPGLDPVLDRTLAESYVALDLGSGLMSSPMGVVTTRPALRRWLNPSVVSLDLDGTGLLSTPMGFRSMTVGTLSAPTSADLREDTSGLLRSSTLGFSGKFAIMGSSGPLGFNINALLEPGESPRVPVSEPLYDAQDVLLDVGQVVGSSGDSSLQGLLDDGAWQRHGFGAASVLVGTGQVQPALEGSSTVGGAVQLER